jgi:phospholipid/cholesterol/gamma-HCH transport system substrate-binding protein
MLLVVTAVFVATSSALFVGAFRPSVPVTLMSDRSGLVMESGAKVKMRGIEVGRVAGVVGGATPVRLRLELDPDQVRYIPANVGAQIRATTVLGAKFVDLIPPSHPSSQHLSAGAVLFSRNVTTEVNTVFENLVGVLKQVNPDKLNAVLSAVSEGVRGQGHAMGQAITDTDQVLAALNARSDTLRQDVRAAAGFGETYASATADIVRILDAASTTSATVTSQRADLNSLLLNTIGLADAGTQLLGTSSEPLIRATDVLEPTTALLLKYSPSYTCTLVGAKLLLDTSGKSVGGNGATGTLDGGLAPALDPYRYPDNLPIVAAKGGPGGKPGCGSLPDVAKAFPVKYLVTNTGFGTGLDMRPNPGIAHPWFLDFFPVTRAVPEKPLIVGDGPPAIGPVPYPGAPPYGAPEYEPDGTPLYPPPGGR